MRIVVLGGGFGGVATVRHLERVLRRRTNVELTLLSRENFFVLTPLLFEACSGWNINIRCTRQDSQSEIFSSKCLILNGDVFRTEYEWITRIIKPIVHLCTNHKLRHRVIAPRVHRE
jgi:hypothetical protein